MLTQSNLVAKRKEMCSQIDHVKHQHRINRVDHKEQRFSLQHKLIANILAQIVTRISRFYDIKRCCLFFHQSFIQLDRFQGPQFVFDITFFINRIWIFIENKLV